MGLILAQRGKEQHCFLKARGINFNYVFKEWKCVTLAIYARIVYCSTKSAKATATHIHYYHRRGIANTKSSDKLRYKMYKRIECLGFEKSIFLSSISTRIISMKVLYFWKKFLFFKFFFISQSISISFLVRQKVKGKIYCIAIFI